MSKIVSLFGDRDIALKETVISKTADEEKPYRFKGPSILLNKRNSNGRIYPEFVQGHVDTYAATKMIPGRNQAVGELNHPTDEKTASVDLTKVSHVFTSLVREGDYVVAEGNMIKGHPAGNMAIALCESGVTLGISSRCLGKLDKDKVVLQDGFMLITPGDFVWGPSAYEAYASIIKEHTDLAGTFGLTEYNFVETKRLIDSNRLKAAFELFNYFSS